MKLMNIIRKNYVAGNKVFGVAKDAFGGRRNCLFSIVPGFDSRVEGLYGGYECSGSVLPPKKMELIGYFVCGTAVLSQDSAYFFDIENSDFSIALFDVAARLRESFTDKILEHFQSLSARRPLLKEFDKKMREDEKALYSVRVQREARNLIISGEAPLFCVDIDVNTDDESCILYLLNGDAHVQALVEKTLSTPSCYFRLLSDYIFYLHLLEEIKKPSNQDGLDAAKGVYEAIVHAKEKGASTIRVYVAGKDKNLSDAAVREAPSLSIEGKVIEGRYPADFYYSFLEDGLSPNYFVVRDKNFAIKYKYSNRYVTLFKKIPPDDVLKISFGHHVLYEKPVTTKRKEVAK